MEKMVYLVAVQSEIFEFKTKENQLDFIADLQKQFPDIQFATSEISVED